MPFENLDVQTGKIVSMTPENIVQKSSISHGGYEVSYEAQQSVRTGRDGRRLGV